MKKIEFTENAWYNSVSMAVVKAFFLIVAVVAFVSCTEQGQDFVSNANTLKSLALSLDEDTDWVRGPGREEKENPEKHRVAVSDENAFFQKMSQADKVWPVMEDFTSLDISCFSENRILGDSLDSFCRAFLSGRTVDGLKTFFHPSHVYSLRIFLLDVDAAFPETEFSSFVLGKPFILEDYASCPVKFSSSDGGVSFAVKVNFILKEGFWKISSISFMHKGGIDAEQ